VFKKTDSIIQFLLSRIKLPSFSNFYFHNLLTNVDKFKNLNLLGYGLKFCPKPKEPSRNIYETAINDLVRRVKVHDFWLQRPELSICHEEYDPRLKTTSDWCPNHAATSPECQILTQRIQLESRVLLSKHTNRQRSSIVSQRLIRLRHLKDIKIVQTDKNLGLCVLNIERYDQMVKIHLRDDVHYEVISSEIGYYGSPDWKILLTSISKTHAALFKRAAATGLLTDQAIKFLRQSKADLPQFHVLPKLHKKTSPIPSRPIIGAVNWITTNWALVLTSVLEKIKCEFIIKNSFALIEELENHHVEDTDFFISADVSSLYTMMNLERLYQCMQSRDVNPLFVDILKFICEQNYFLYGSRVYRQKDGIAMGFNAAVHCANIYLDGFDGCFSQKFHYYARYIDDIFMIFKGSRSELDQILRDMNNAIIGIKLNYVISQFETDFLDLTVFKDGGRIKFKTFQKENNIYQYIPPHSYHNPACISGFIKAELIRYVRCNTNIADRRFMSLLLYNRLLARSFARSFLNRVFLAVDLTCRIPIRPEIVSPEKIMALIIPFYRNKTTRELKHLFYILNEFQFTKDLKIRFLIAFKRNPNVMQLCSRSNISTAQEDLIMEKELYGQ